MPKDPAHDHDGSTCDHPKCIARRARLTAHSNQDERATAALKEIADARAAREAAHKAAETDEKKT